MDSLDGGDRAALLRARTECVPYVHLQEESMKNKFGAAAAIAGIAIVLAFCFGIVISPLLSRALMKLAIDAPVGSVIVGRIVGAVETMAAVFVSIILCGLIARRKYPMFKSISASAVAGVSNAIVLFFVVVIYNFFFSRFIYNVANPTLVPVLNIFMTIVNYAISFCIIFACALIVTASKDEESEKTAAVGAAGAYQPVVPVAPVEMPDDMPAEAPAADQTEAEA